MPRKETVSVQLVPRKETVRFKEGASECAVGAPRKEAVRLQLVSRTEAVSGSNFLLHTNSSTPAVISLPPSLAPAAHSLDPFSASTAPPSSTQAAPPSSVPAAQLYTHCLLPWHQLYYSTVSSSQSAQMIQQQC